VKNYKQLIIIICSLLFVASLLLGVKARFAIAEEEEDSRNLIIVSIGDSYASGEGIPPFYGQEDAKKANIQNGYMTKPVGWLAHRSVHSWEGMLTLDGVDGSMSDERNIGTHWFFVAASGATTENLYYSQHKTVNNNALDAMSNLYGLFSPDD
jgi:hypothetical protein